MKKLFLLFFVVLSIAMLSACKKSMAPAPVIEIKERKIVYMASLIPVKLEMDKHLKATVYFKTADRPYFIMLDNIQGNYNLGAINNAIKEEKLLKLYRYQGSLEIARLEW